MRGDRERPSVGGGSLLAHWPNAPRDVLLSSSRAAGCAARGSPRPAASRPGTPAKRAEAAWSRSPQATRRRSSRFGVATRPPTPRPSFRRMCTTTSRSVRAWIATPTRSADGAGGAAGSVMRRVASAPRVSREGAPRPRAGSDLGLSPQRDRWRVRSAADWPRIARRPPYLLAQTPRRPTMLRPISLAPTTRAPETEHRTRPPRAAPT